MSNRGLVERAVGAVRFVIVHLDAVPYCLLALPLRAAVATVFWNSGTTKLADWSATLQLFMDEYMLPVVPPQIAATVGTTIELSTSVLLIVGLATRFSAAALLAMTAVIECIYPEAWPVHIQWAAMLLVLLCRGAGRISLDGLIGRRFMVPD
jgi:putative oxidoreductase